ncbi:hypothetical protein Ahy_Scaffold1g106864 isoform B [Arachis hypogaea]|uniref:Uncharacterized protein n=1 Tax=Arachis hypogaea TaxID=3818 RepID=A0A444WSQ6_ARAHY|nr:hypothetical protein Ahy_Scaffold1g106864 isoform B [Arachis hypogaea]
MRHRTQVSRRR